MISKQRLQQQLAALNEITAPGRGINRLAFTDADWRGRSYLMGLMREAGMELREDAFGNVIGHVQGADESLPAVMFGSHGDSVPEGGNFDGIVGILAAIETVRSMREDGFTPKRPLEVVLFLCEESSRFSAATLGSRAMRGELSQEDLVRLHDKEGHTLYEVLKGHGLDPDHIESARYTKPLRAFLELHIEQGKVLEHEGLPIALSRVSRRRRGRCCRRQAGSCAAARRSSAAGGAGNPCRTACRCHRTRARRAARPCSCCRAGGTRRRTAEHRAACRSSSAGVSPRR